MCRRAGTGIVSRDKVLFQNWPQEARIHAVAGRVYTLTTKPSATWNILNRCTAAAILFLAAAGGAAEGGAAWRDVSRRAVLTNEVLEARFCSGIIYQLKEREEGKLLLSVEPEALPAEIPLFGGRRIDLDNCEVFQLSLIHI